MNLILHFKYGQNRHALHKTLLIMKLVIIMLITAILQVSGSTYAQKITLNKTNAALETVIKEIRKQSGYYFIYTLDQLKDAKPVNIKVNNADLKDVLEMCFKNQPLNFSIEQKTIVIKQREPSFLDQLKDVTLNLFQGQTIDVRGRVVDEKGQPLIGASVSVKGGKGTTTDKNGSFYLARVDEKAVLVISFIGYLVKEVNATADFGTIVLEISNSTLDEVQVIAYGTTSQRYSTSNIGTIKTDGIQRQPVSNPILALSGRIPGLYIRQRSGINNGSIDVKIQGTNSLQNSNDPFYVVDGVPYASTFGTQSLGSISQNGNGNPFNFLNPADIESISVLKDADATAIYGSRAANGAILISTKKGVAGKTSVNLNFQNGWGKITRKADLVNRSQYLELRKERFTNDRIAIPTATTTPSSSNYDLTYWDQDKDTDWQEVLIGGTSKFTDLQGSISGGSINTQFLASYGYHNETTVYPAKFYDRKGNVRFNLTHKSPDDRFKFMLTGSYLQAKNTLGNQDIAANVNRLAPNMPDLLSSDGELNWAYLPDGTTSTLGINALTFLKQQYTGQTSNLIADNSISYELIKGLNLKATLGYNKLNTDETLFTPISIYGPALPTEFKVRSAGYLTKSISTWIAEPQLTYNRKTNLGVFDLFLGTTFQQSQTDLLTQSGSGFAADAQLPDITAAPTRTIDVVDFDRYNYTAVFGRINYRLHDKYIVNLNIRRDGSSRFGPESRFHTFYAIGGAWLFGDEEIIKQRLPWLSYAKLRGSYGTTGNDQIGNYRFFSLLSNYTAAQIPYQDGMSLQVNKIDNPFLQWEETRKLSLGLDVGIVKNRIMINLTYARNRSSNQLINDILPRITGMSAVDINFPALVENVSYEAQLNIVPVKTSEFSWNFSGNITLPKNKLLDFPNLVGSNYERTYVIGQPISIKQVYPFAGVNPQTGVYQFRNAKGEFTSLPNSTLDRTMLINVDPKFYGGVSNTFSYKGFQLDFLFQFIKQIGVVQKYSGTTGGINVVPLRSVLDRWQKPGDVTDIQKISGSIQTLLASSAILQSEANYGDASFIRLKNTALSYSLPKSWIDRVKITNAKFYMQGQNLLTITNFYGTDPEGIVGALPPLRVFTTGVQITF